MTALYRFAAAAVVGSLLTGCASGTAPVTPASTVASVPSSPATPDGAEAPPAAGSSTTVELPWPARGAAEAGALQSQVDAGSQSWLLDPAELALSYVAAAHGWSGADATSSAGTGDAGEGTVDVRASDGRAVSLTVTQPGRTGTGGIWVITGEDPA